MTFISMRNSALGAALVLLAAAASAQTVVFQERFDGGLGQFSGSGSVYVSDASARLAGAFGSGKGAITSAPIDTTGVSRLSLTFSRSTSGLDLGEAGVASVSINGGAFTTLESTRSASGPTTIALPEAAANQAQIRLRFAVSASSGLESYTVDDIVLSGQRGDEPPPTGGGTLPPVSSVDADGPFATNAATNTGPARAGWVVHPATLGANGLKHPVFIWGPGAGTGPSNYDFHLRRIASHGFIVYSETSTSSGSEMKAAIDWLIAENGRPASPYYQKIDTARIAAGGHSRGSVGTFAIASDPRLKTTIHVAGGSFDGQGSRNLRKPAAYICGSEDTTATPNCRNDYTATTTPVFFTVITGATHINAAREGLPAIVAWLRWHLADETDRRASFLAPGGAFTTGKWVSQQKNW
jgi:hypothetical protein